MVNKFLSKAIEELKRRDLDAFLFTLINENLYEFTKDIENPLIELTGFTGDTGKLLITRKKAYLLVDFRFTIQAKKQKNDSRIEVVEINRDFTIYDFYKSIFKKNYRLGVNPKRESISNVLISKKILAKFGHITVPTTDFFEKELKEVKKNYFKMSSAPIFLLDKKYVSLSSHDKIKHILETLKMRLDSKIVNNLLNHEMLGEKIIDYEKDFSMDKLYYVTSSLEEIAYITNLRYRFSEIDNHGPLFKAFLVINKKHSFLYVDDYLEDDAMSYIAKEKIEARKLSEFYGDLKLIKDKKYLFLDPDINNYYIFKSLGINERNLITTPLIDIMSIKGDVEIKNLKKANVLDGVAITKAIYNIKTSSYKDEYEIMQMVDKTREEIGKDKYLGRSFNTIVAYKENSAICHYAPTMSKSKKIKNENLLLIDSGGNYLYGSTDITRTISLYKNKKQIPYEMKKNYTLVLMAMFHLCMQKFPHGITGTELDIIVRQNFYNNYVDFGHSTGHGIGYISNVHEGPNRIGPGIPRNHLYNVIEPNQVVSDEPGLYFEGKYGIRIENDILSVEDKENEYGQFLRFESLTLCPFEKDLIDKSMIDKETYKYLDSYNKLVYRKLSPYMNQKEKKWLKEMTCL